MNPRMIHSATVSSKTRGSIGSSSLAVDRNYSTIGRAPSRFQLGSRRISSRDLQIVEATDELLDAEVPEPDGVASDVSLLRGFNATIPSSEKSKTRRRQTRNVEARINVKRIGMGPRGLITDDDERESVISEDDVVFVGRSDRGRHLKAKRKRGRESLSANIVLGKEELLRQTQEIEKDKENLHVRRVCRISLSPILNLAPTFFLGCPRP